MNALEPDPEQKNRWKRFVIGGCVAGGLATALLVGAQHIDPAHRLMPEILQMAVVDDFTPPKKDEVIPPPPPPPPPPKAKRDQPKEEAKPVEQPKQDDAPEPEQMAEAEAGLDNSSFATGGAGISFRSGKTQMGDPNRAAKKGPVEPPKLSLKPPKMTPARALNPELPTYPERARKANIQGYVLLEAEIDQRGILTGVHVRQGLERELDAAAIASVKRWKFEPALLGGRTVPSTKLLRIRFELN